MTACSSRADGRVDLVDSATGEPRAEPYLPVFDRAHPVRWRAPVRVVGEPESVVLADESGRLIKLTLDRREGKIARLQVTADASLGEPLADDPVSVGPSLVVVTRDRKVRALATRDLSPAGAWPLQAPLAASPSVVAGHAFLADLEGNLHVFGPDGQRLWSVVLRSGVPFGPPVVVADTVCFLTRAGSLERHGLIDGAFRGHTDLGILPAGPLQVSGDRLLVPTGLGSYRSYKIE